jgi:hypothetical protein
MKRMVNQKKKQEKKEKTTTSKLTPRSKQAIKLEIDRIKELGLSGEDTFLMACSMINTAYYLNQKIEIDYTKHKNQWDKNGKS